MPQMFMFWFRKVAIFFFQAQECPQIRSFKTLQFRKGSPRSFWYNCSFDEDLTEVVFMGPRTTADVPISQPGPRGMNEGTLAFLITDLRPLHVVLPKTLILRIFGDLAQNR